MAGVQGVVDRLSLACSVCKTEPLEKLHYISHILGKRHQKNLKNRSKALRKDEMLRTLHITGFKKDTPVEMLLGTLYRYEVVNISPFQNYCFVELRSRQTVQKCLDEEHYVGSQKLKVSLRHQSQDAGTSSPPIRLSWRTQMALNQKVSSAQSQWHAIGMLIKDIELKSEHYEQREYLRQTLENFLRPDFPGAMACVFGSSANNLGFVGCDVDLYVHLGVNPWSVGSKAQKEAKARDLTWYLARKLKNMKRGFKNQSEILAGWSTWMRGSSAYPDVTAIAPPAWDVTAIAPPTGGAAATWVLINELLTFVHGRLADTLRQNLPLYKRLQVQAIAKARVPIVKFEDALTRLQVDLSFRNGMPVYNTQLICQYTRTHSLVRPYLMVIRYWAKIQEIAGGGQPTYLITNYGFTMLMLFYLMARDEPLIPSVFELKAQCPPGLRAEHTVEGWDCSFGQDVSAWAAKKHNVTVLELVCEFFEYYGQIDPRKWVVSPLAGRLLEKSAVKERDAKRLPPCMEQYYLQETDIQLETALCLQDPFEHSYNITRGLQAGPLTEFQYKCRKAAEICNEVISQDQPLAHLFEEVFIDESILSSIQTRESPPPKEVDITQEEIITLDDSDEVSQGEDVSQDEIQILDMDPSSSSSASTSNANGKLPKGKGEEEEIEICSANEDLSIEEIQQEEETNDSGVEEIPNGEAVNGDGGGEKTKSTSVGLLLGQQRVVPQAAPEKNFFKFNLDFSQAREFTLTFDGCISGGKEVMKSEDDIGHAASSLIHFVLQQCLKMEVNPTGTPSEDGKRKSESPERTGSGKRIKNADGNVVNVVPAYRKVSEYRCSTENQLWVGRRKASKAVPKSPNDNPLQYEMAVTQMQMASCFAENGRIGISNGQTLELVVSLWQKLDKPSEVLVTGDSLSNDKLTQGMMMPLFLYLSYLAPALLGKVSMYIVRTSTKR